MKLNSLKIDITGLKPVLPEGVRVEEIKQDLIEAGAIVKGYVEDGNVFMLIDGKIDPEIIEDIFSDYDVDVNDFIVEDGLDYPDYDEADDVEVFDNNNNDYPDYDEVSECDGDDCIVNEKKGDCCPKKKVNEKKNRGPRVNLAEALAGRSNNNRVSLDEVIDNMTGRSVSQNIAESAIRKAKHESLREQLGDKKYKMICESLEANKTSLYEKTKINGKTIAEYTKEELVAIKEKADNKIATLGSINEGDKTKEQVAELTKMQKLSSILEDEITYRTSLEIMNEDDTEVPGFEFKNLNPNAEEEKKDDEKKDEKNEEVKEADDAEEKTDDKEEKKDDAEDEEKSEDEEQNPDEDEEVNVNSIVITLATKQDAEDLKQDLVDAGVPEDVLEIEKVEDEAEEDEENAEEETSEEDTEEKSDEEKAAEEESPKESLKSDGEKLNEADEDENAEEDKPEDAGDEEKADDEKEGDDEGDDAPHKLILTDTDYANDLADVLENIWGMEQDEFEELIGGEIVSDDEDEEDTEGDKDNADEESADDMDFDPDELFKDL